MTFRRGAGLRVLTLAIAILGIAAGARAQTQTGNIFGSVADTDGESLAGVTVTLAGGGAPMVQVTNAEGDFRFIGVYPGSYTLSALLDGFSPVEYPGVVVNVGRNTAVQLTMNQAVSETITITAQTDLLDPRRITTGATIDKTELEKIPTARDPWVILQTTPGVLVDRVNVGGNESGQQSNYTGNGDDGSNSTWSIDGVEITDVGAIGSSSSYYDFDAFEELQISTGGSDTTARTGGVGLNLVTKRGTNEWRGSARYLTADESWQSDLNADSGKFGRDFDGAGVTTAQAAFNQGNRIVSVEDYGAEIGGPILKDKLWIWGSYGENDIQLLTVDDFADNTQLETWNAKLNWQVAQNNSATVFFSNNDKTKQGRNASPQRPQETTWNQSSLAYEPDFFGFFSERPTVAKIEDTHIFGSSFFLTGMFSESDGGFQLIPQGGATDNQVNTSWDETFTWHNSFVLYQSERPQDQYKADGSYFLSTGDVNHELKFGVNYRAAEVYSYSRWPGFGLDLNFYQSYGYYYNVVQVSRDSQLNYEVEYTNAYLQDTLTIGNLTANLGLRYDIQESRNLPASVRANPAFPTLLPASTYPGADNNFEWKTLSPRLGLTYAIGEEKKTLLRASYARFAEQMGGVTASWNNPGYPGGYVYFYYDDTNGDSSAQPGELLFPELFFNYTYNPHNPSEMLISSATDPNLDAPLSDEIVLGVEHALLPEFVVGVTATWRNESDILGSDLLVFDGDPFSVDNVNSLGRRATRADYEVRTTLTGTLPDGSTYSRPVYDILPNLATRGGAFLFNSDVEREYLGISLVANKRLSNRWMMRGNFTWNDWEWKVPEGALSDPTQAFGGGNQDGDRVLVCSGTGSGPKAGVCISSAWSYSLTGLYQVAPERPWGFNLGASLNGREGYANPYWRRIGATGLRKNPNGALLINVTDRPDDYANDDLHQLDLRVEKEFDFERFGLTVGIDAFNVLNEGTVLQRNLRMSRVNTDHVLEVVSPRIFRLGARLSFN